MQKNIKPLLLVLLVALLIVLSGCNPAQPVPQATSTIDPAAIAATSDVLRTQVAGTVVGGMTQTAEANPPTATPLPTEEPTTPPTATTAPATLTPPPTIVVPAATATRRVILPTATPTQGKFQCIVTEQSITYNMKVQAGVDFDARWKIKNVGTDSWASGAMDYVYVDGDRLHTGDDAYDLNQEVKTGKTTDIIVDMIAPKDSGRYNTTWAVTQDGTTVCTLRIDIIVE